MKSRGEEHRTSTPLLCAVCIANGLPEALALIGDHETVYATEDGEPACESCGMDRGYFPWRLERRGLW